MPRGIPNNNAKPSDIVINGEIVDQGQSLEPIISAEKDLTKIVNDEAFFNEFVTIEVADSSNPNDPPSLVLNVNGRCHGILRGQPTKLRRCFVEILARCKETIYTPQDPDYKNPEISNQPKGRTAFTYPFTVIDDTPRGHAWLAAVKAEPA